MTSFSNFFWRDHIFLLKFRQWPEFHVNTITGSRVMTIFIYKEFDQKSRNWKGPHLHLNFVQYGKGVSKEQFLNVTKW